MKKLYFALIGTALLASCSTNEPQRAISIIPVPVSVQQQNGTLNIADTAGKVCQMIDTTIANAEGYTLLVDKSGIQMRAKTEVGLLYAHTTLQQITSPKGEIPYVQISDYPRFPYRGFMLDVSRHFYDTEQIKHLLRIMARYKLNRFHWHLTDDQGWRIEIKKYPLLTQKGAWRRFNNQDRDCQQFAVQHDNTDFNIPEARLRIEGTDTLYGGYYTQQEIIQVVDYAARLGIEVIPELDMPGHLMAAMTGYAQISCKGKPQWGELFSDPLCLGNDQAITMVKDIYTEVAALFPSQYMHLGADEVDHTNWKTCGKCQQRIKQNGLKGVEELQSWFVDQMEAHFGTLGKKLIGWDEITMGGLSKTATIMWWRNWAPDAVPIAVQNGNKAIISPCFTHYLDYWESEETLKNVYLYNPIPESVTKEQAENILGVQANMWCESIPSLRRVEHQMMLRLLAIAEMGWSQPSAINWDDFIQRVIREVEYLDANNINYRVPSLTGFDDLNVFIDTITVTAKCVLPNIEIRYTTDGTAPTVISPRLDHKMVIDNTTEFIFRSFRPNGTAGEMQKAIFRKETHSAPVEVGGLKSGLAVTRYKYKGSRCAQITTDGTVVEHKTMDSLNFTVDNSLNWGDLGLVGRGYIDVPADGIYLFELTSDDGSTLWVDGQQLINFDGAHSATTKKAQRAMAKGLHPIEIYYFENNNGGSLKLELDGRTITNFKH